MQRVLTKDSPQHLLTQKGPSPIKVLVLKEWLRHYPDKVAASYLLSGFRLGFRIPAVGPRYAAGAMHLKSVKGMELIVQSKIDREVVPTRNCT